MNLLIEIFSMAPEMIINTLNGSTSLIQGFFYWLLLVACAGLVFSSIVLVAYIIHSVYHAIAGDFTF